ncbi:hypothetical protein A2382_03110 [Candidatus Woesebacteria bacterium RIFOXYB1_FULL_38_16]|uniref:DUF5659 domain-containing protein n=1 Tax=Candidatus Woesebacteria bacterium RIFOXYB1_FULL_38_16 TaxID=1802538 RepID=A0A1F8CU86_9BACT|nr:MAG: hypothetical protein A2382_03110 [Candidatus Woesebacteria bacterium RIFOXYB1_FULL_38_16]
MSKQYKTKDIYEASALVASKMKLLNLERGSGFYWFVFQSGDLSRKTSELFWRNELSVLAKDYADALRTLKDRIFANK